MLSWPERYPHLTGKCGCSINLLADNALVSIGDIVLILVTSSRNLLGVSSRVVWGQIKYSLFSQIEQGRPIGDYP